MNVSNILFNSLTDERPSKMLKLIHTLFFLLFHVNSPCFSADLYNLLLLLPYFQSDFPLLSLDYFLAYFNIIKMNLYFEQGFSILY